MKFEVNKSYITRNGRKAVIKEIAPKEFYPVRAKIDGLMHMFDTKGFNIPGIESDLDLVRKA